MNAHIVCQQIDPLLDAYVDDELPVDSPIAEEAIARHVTNCQPCLEHVMIVRHLKTRLSRLSVESGEPGTAHLVDRILIDHSF